MSISPNSILVPGYCLANKYEIEQPIGHGGSGCVYAAHNILLNDRVAIKVLYDASDTERERLVREARAAVRIRSEHVVRVFDVGEIDKVGPYIVMEHLEGVDLSQRVKRSAPLDVTTAIDCLVQVCEALSIAHDLGIVHRDLKPANLFHTERGDGSPWVKILDFGISKTREDHAEGLTSTHAVFGTPAFMSPEQLRSTRDVDHRTDIWALGAILFHLTTGKLPFPGDSSIDVAAKILRDPCPSARAIRSDVPEGVDAIIERCLRKEPGLRWKNVGQLMQALEPYCSPRYHELIRRAAATTASRRMLLENEPSSAALPFVTTVIDETTGANASWSGPLRQKTDDGDAQLSKQSRARIALASIAMFLTTLGIGFALYPRSPSAAAETISPVAIAPTQLVQSQPSVATPAPAPSQAAEPANTIAVTPPTAPKRPSASPPTSQTAASPASAASAPVVKKPYQEYDWSKTVQPSPR